MDNIIYHTSSSPQSTWAIIKDIATVVLALCSLCWTIFWASYVFFRQTAREQKKAEQTVRLQWFKDLIITPHLSSINDFFKSLENIKVNFTTSDLADDQKQEINEFIKAEQRKLRKEIIDLLLAILPNLGNKFNKTIDDLTDQLTEAIFNDELKLNNSSVYEKSIGNPIQTTKTTIIKLIFSYNGED